MKGFLTESHPHAPSQGGVAVNDDDISSLLDDPQTAQEGIMRGGSLSPNGPEAGVEPSNKENIQNSEANTHQAPQMNGSTASSSSSSMVVTSVDQLMALINKVRKN